MAQVDSIKMNKHKFSWRCFFLGHVEPRSDNWARVITFQSMLKPGMTIDIAFFECGRCNKIQWHRHTRKT